MENLFLDLTDNQKEKLEQLFVDGRAPHAVILEGDDSALLSASADYLAAMAVCDEPQKPCTKCKNCTKSINKIHPDINYTKGTGTGGRINVSDIRRICSDTFIKPNEAGCKVYILDNCDILNVQSQNAFLKSLEEPVQNILFILKCTSSYSLLETIRSRCVTINIKSQNIARADDEALQLAEKISEALCESTEYPLLCATYFSGKDRSYYVDVLEYLKKILASACLNNNEFGRKEILQNLNRYIGTKKLIQVIGVVDEAVSALFRNSNMNLLSTWLCSHLFKIKEDTGSDING